MKVICIDAKARYAENTGLLKLGETYTVIGEAPRGADGEHGWFLAEVKNIACPEYGWRKCRFLEVGQMDETERLEAWQSEHLTQEDKLFKELAETMPEKELPQKPFERGWRDLVHKMEGAL